MEEEIVKWNIQVSSKSDRHGLTNQDIDFIMHCRDHPICQSMIKKLDDELKDHLEESIYIWQCDKSNEFRDKIYEKMVIVLGEEIKFKSEFSIMLPESFDEQDVISWTSTYGMTDFLSYFMEVVPISSNACHPQRASSIEFLKELRKNQIFEAKICTQS